METKELVDHVLEIFDVVGKAYYKKYETQISVAERISLFERAHSHEIHLAIGAEHRQKKQNKEADKFKPDHCNDCGRQLTEKEQDFIKMKGTESICYHCSKK